MMTTGIPAWLASLTTLRERLVVERREHDAVHLARDEVLDDLDLLSASSSSFGRALPQDVDVRFLRRGSSAPAWIDFQNSCVVPFGITAMTTRSSFALQATRTSTRTTKRDKRMRMAEMVSNPGC